MMAVAASPKQEDAAKDLKGKQLELIKICEARKYCMPDMTDDRKRTTEGNSGFRTHLHALCSDSRRLRCAARFIQRVRACENSLCRRSYGGVHESRLQSPTVSFVRRNDACNRKVLQSCWKRNSLSISLIDCRLWH